MAVSKVILNGQTLIDVTEDTVASNNLLQGNQATGADGQKVSGAYVAPTFSVQAKTVTPSESQQTILPDAGYDGLSQVQVGAISSSYIGSGVPKKSSADLTADEDTVTVPAGYYASSAAKSVAQGTAGTPTAVKGAVSNHSISITPTVTNTSGYIDGGTKTGSAVSVTASELVSGMKTINENGPSDVTNYASVTVNVEPNVEALTVIPSESEQTFEGGTVDGYKPVTVSAIPSNYVGSGVPQKSSSDLTVNGLAVMVPVGYYSSPASATGEPNVEALTVTPSESEQVFEGGTVDGYKPVTVSAIPSDYVGTSITKKAAQTYTPGTTNQTIAAGQYLSGAQTILGDANLVASNIASGISIFGVQGTHEGGVSEEDVNIKWITGAVSGSHSYSINGIHSYAFAAQSITDVSLPNVGSVPSGAFTNCTNLKHVDIPNCTYINDRGFYLCVQLLSISFPLCSSIGTSVFINCFALSTVCAPNLTLVGESAFATCGIQSAVYSKCTRIGSAAFMYCGSLSLASFDILSSIPQFAFFNSPRLQSISFPLCSLISSSAFRSCSALESVYIPQCQRTYTYAFANCSALSSIDLPACTSLGDSTFTYCTSLQTVSLPECLDLGHAAFSNCSALENVYIPKVRSLRPYTFYSCLALSSLELPNCSSVGDLTVFSGCINLRYLSIPNLSTVGAQVFKNLQALESIDLPNCSYISNAAFNGCINLSVVKLYSVRSIRASAFLGCTNLMSLYLYSLTACGLENSMAFDGTPLSAGGSGIIYAPRSLLGYYAGATGWSGISSRFSAIEDAS